ncbi:MAG TPA: 2OG-Fe(II) oxygenase [Pyrinomonadaceae bacterium]
MNNHGEDGRRDFTWHEFDAETFLPRGWAEQVTSFALEASEMKVLVPTSVTSREASSDIAIPILTIGGVKIKESLRWLFDLYRGTFRDLGQTCVNEPLLIGADERHAIVINAQRGTNMRYECHVDTNPLSGLLFVTSHPPGNGGELVVANKPAAVGVEDIGRDCKMIYPDSGKMIFFDAREHPHFVRPLRDPFGVRVVVVMNFYTPSGPESDRPKDLTFHMFGRDR